MTIYTNITNHFSWPARANGSTALSPDAFRLTLERERARVDRDGNMFSLIVFQGGGSPGAKADMKFVAASLAKRIRMTDALGWTEQGNLGLLLYNTGHEGASHVANLIEQGFAQSSKIVYHIHQYPQNGGRTADMGNGAAPDKDGAGGEGSPRQEIPPSIPALSGETLGRGSKRSSAHEGKASASHFPGVVPWWKRAVDISGSALGLALLFPLFIAVAAAIKVSSPGPVFFKQERVGYRGRHFTCFKFRTMHQDADPRIHQKYLTDLIDSASTSDAEARPMKKLSRDPRVIPFIGTMLRATSLDEIPQLINVIRGDMSLIGPRPAIPYEVDRYLPWYNRRFDALPGLTGLWQVSGKNRLTFNQMIRLDIAYVRNCSLSLDIAILLTTPWVVLRQVREVLKAR